MKFNQKGQAALTDSLKVISYINVVRDGRSIEEVRNSGDIFESDYLLALIKEDYANERKMSPPTRKAIVRTLDTVMKPFDAAIDYSFFLLSESEEQYLFLLFATHQCDDGGDDYDGDGISSCLDIDEAKEDYVQRKYYYCEPGDNTILEREVFPTVGKVDTAFGKITLADAAEDEKQGRPFVVGFSGWVATSTPQLTEDNLLNSADYNCDEITLTTT
jgi:hypothetical protein